MDAWQPLQQHLDPKLALALELDLLSDQDLLDATDAAWPTVVGSGVGSGPAPAASSAGHTAEPLLELPLLHTWPLGAGQPFVPVVNTPAAELGGSWSDGAAASQAATAAAAPPAGRGTASSAAGRPATPKRSAKGGASGVGNRYDKPGARERKQEQQRNYRLRCKERAVEQQAQLAALGSAVAAARQQRQQLLDEQVALQKLQEYKDSMTEQLPLQQNCAVPPAEDSCWGSGTQAVLSPPGARAALTDGAAADRCAGADCSGTGTAAGDGRCSSGSGDSSGEAGCSGSGDNGSGGRQLLGSQDGALGSKDGDWESVFPTSWCKVGLASGSLPPPAAELVDAAAALADRQHALRFDGCSGGGGGLLAGMAAALLAVPDALCRRLMNGIKPYQLTERERGFRNLVKAAVEEWEANPAGRRRVERRLQVLWAVRLKCSDWIARVRPEVVAEARASYVLPAPLPSTAATVTGCPTHADGGVEGGVHHILPPIVAQLRISSEQRERILAHWATYQHRVAVARQLSREAIQRLQRQEAARQQGGIPGPGGSLAGAAGHFLASLQAASELATLPPEESVAWFELQHGLWKALTPLQNSRLLLGCAPYLPDCTQLCRLLEWQEQRQQLSRGDSGHFLATAVAV